MGNTLSQHRKASTDSMSGASVGSTSKKSSFSRPLSPLASFSRKRSKSNVTGSNTSLHYQPPRLPSTTSQSQNSLPSSPSNSSAGSSPSSSPPQPSTATYPGRPPMMTGRESIDNRSENSSQSLAISRSNSGDAPGPNGFVSSKLPEWAAHSKWCEDGRTRHTVESAPYVLPNDITECNRLDAQHYIVRFCFQGNYNVKLDRSAKIRILDVATGTGVWSLEMAHEFPNAEIHGVDISPIFPTSIKPANCHFQLCNILDGLPYPDNHFDFIYQRLLVYALTPAQRQQVNIELHRVLKPGGHLQLVESDGLVYNSGPVTDRVNALSLQTPMLRGINPKEVQTLKPGLKRAGYVHVNSFNMALPVGDWGGKVGKLSLQNMHGLATIWLMGQLGRQSQEECDKTLIEMDKECESLQAFYKVWLVVCEKKK